MSEVCTKQHGTYSYANYDNVHNSKDAICLCCTALTLFKWSIGGNGLKEINHCRGKNKGNRVDGFTVQSICNDVNTHRNQANLRDLIAATGLLILLKLDSNRRFSARVTFKFDGWPRKIIGHHFYTTSSSVHHIVAIGEFKLEYSPETPNGGQIQRFLKPCDFAI